MTTSNNSTKQPKKNELNRLIQRNLPYWFYFLLSLVIFGILGGLYLHFKSPVFQASASILIKKDNNGSSNNQFISPMDVFSSQKLVENETSILESYNLMRKVVKKLDLYAPVFVDRNLQKGELNDRSGYVLSPIRIQIKSPDDIIPSKDSAKIYFEYKNDKVRINGRKYDLNTWDNSPWGEIRFIPNPAFKPKEEGAVGEMYFVWRKVDQVAHGLINKVNIKPSSQHSTIINLYYNDVVPKRGKDILNAIVHYYSLESQAYKNILASNMIGFLNNRIFKVKKRLDSIENSLQNYKVTKSGLDLDNQSQLILTSLSENGKKSNEINVQIATLEQIKRYVNGKGGNPGIVALSDKDNVLSNYLEKLYEAELNYDRLRQTTAENNVSLRSLKTQIKKIKPTILQYVDNKIQTLEITKSHLDNSNRKYNSQLAAIPLKQRDLLELNRKKTNINDLYDFLLKKKEEATLSYGAKVSDTRIIDQAIVSPYPVSPKRKMVMGVVVLLGLGVPFILLKWNEKILTKEEVIEILDLPILGEVSKLSRKEPYLISKGKYNLISEQFRQIRISLAFAQGVDIDHNKFMVTSSISGEGKSFVAANLAINLTLTNKKVLLIDLDLHQPTLNKHFNISNAVGVSDYLLNKATLDDIITKPRDNNNNLYVIPSGENLAEPSETLLNGKLTELLSEAEDIFDYIVLDTAPVNIISDAYNISSLCDASLFVARYKYTPKSELVSFKENSSSRKLKNTGVILNGVQSIGAKKYKKKYYSYVKREAKKENFPV